MNITSGFLNLLMKVPDDVKSKLVKFSNNENILKGQVELVVIYGDGVAEVSTGARKLGGTLEDLGFGFGIITIGVDKIEQLASIPQIQYIELPKTLFTSFMPSNDDSCVTPVWDIYGLSGEGVLVGFVDSGIDYLHPAFMDEVNNTRIDYIYDLSQGNKGYDSQDINLAIKSPNPLAIVPETDELGHGTHVAGIACAGGKIDKRYFGAAFKSKIAMVKMTGSGKVNYAKSTQLMRGIKILIDRSRRLNIPLVINISFSTNDGAHDGQSLLEQYIRTVSSLERVTIVIAAGNEGDAGHHVGGILQMSQEIDFNISGDEISLILQLYKNILDDISIEIKSPAGVSSGVYDIKQGFIQGSIGDDYYFIYDSGPKPFSINGEIIISFIPKGDFLLTGTWSLTITLKSPGRKYNMWMPVSEGLNSETKFLKPNPLNTLGIPATVFNVIAVGSYDSATDSISSFSGRGDNDRNPVRPDLVAPGENIESALPGGGFGPLSGTSMATPEVAGSAALLMEWGIVKGNDPYIYGERLKYYLLKGAVRNRQQVIYPDEEWGYGKLCLKGAMDLIKSNNRGEDEFRQTITSLNCGDLYINEDYESFIVEYVGDIVGAFKKIDQACAFVLDEKYAVVSVQRGIAMDTLTKVPEIVYIQNSVLYTLESLSPIQSSNIYKFHTSPYLTLRGQGVVVGILDTGIDYLNVEFMYEDSTTRIISMWDQTEIGDKSSATFSFGREYSREEINKAIALKKSGGDPYTIVKEKDLNGHGTAIAGIVGGRGINPDLIGAAPDCEFMICKMKEASKIELELQGVANPSVPVYTNTDVILAVKYLFERGKKLGKPMIILIPVGTNRGGHDGLSLLEQYVDDISRIRGLAVVTGCGNQGDTDTHTAGTIIKTGDTLTIELKVDENQNNLDFSIWFHKPDKVSLGVISPTGEVIEKIPSKLKQTQQIKFIIEGSTLFLDYLIPEELSGDELIKIKLRDIKPGIWQFKLYGDYIVDGRFDAYLPQRPLIMENTKFLNPSPYMTLTPPSTGRSIISVAFFNQDNNTIVSASGRGFTRDLRIKPDLAAGGVNVTTTAVGGGTTTITGSSAGAALIAGASALLFEWGIVNGNDSTMFSTTLKTYLIRGTTKRPGDVYPNQEWGYGIFDMQAVFDNTRDGSAVFNTYDNNEAISAFANQAEEDWIL